MPSPTTDSCSTPDAGFQVDPMAGPSARWHPLRVRRGGFTVAEFVVATTLAGLIAAIALPVFQGNIYRTRAANIIRDLHSVRAAAHMYHADHQSWPEDGPAGVLPDDLAEYVPAVAFDGVGYELDWQLWPVPEGAVVGISVIAGDPGLDAALAALVPAGEQYLRLDGHYTLIVDASNGSGVPGAARGTQGGRGRGPGQRPQPPASGPPDSPGASGGRPSGPPPGAPGGGRP